MTNTPTHNVYLAEDYERDGEKKSHFTNIGSAWLKDTGTISVEIRPNLSVSGRFIILPKDDSSESSD